MNIEYLRNYIKLSQYKSFSKLAKELLISQSTLSHQLSQLEKDFGENLINRTTKKFELTKAGKILLENAKRIVDLYDSSKIEILKFKNQIEEYIIISASTIPGSHILPRYIASFRNNNPNINFKILINNSQKSIENLKTGKVDFAGIGSFMNENERDFDYIKLGEDEFKFICSPNHELIKNKDNIVYLDELKNYPFVWREKGSGMRNTFKQQFPEYKDLNIELEFNDNDSIISTVSESNYISIMSEMMANKAESAGLIKSLKIKNHPVIAKRQLYFVKLKGKQISQLKKKFWEEIKSEF